MKLLPLRETRADGTCCAPVHLHAIPTGAGQAVGNRSTRMHLILLHQDTGAREYLQINLGQMEMSFRHQDYRLSCSLSRLRMRSTKVHFTPSWRRSRSESKSAQQRRLLKPWRRRDLQTWDPAVLTLPTSLRAFPGFLIIYRIMSDILVQVNAGML